MDPFPEGRAGLSQRWKDGARNRFLGSFGLAMTHGGRISSSHRLARGAREREIGYPEQRESWATAEFREANSSLMQIDRSRSSPAAFPLDFSFYF